MRLEITRIEGRRNDLLLRLDLAEIETARLSVANRADLLALPGMPRHRPATDEETDGIARAKVPIEAHLQRLGIVDAEGKASRRAVAISNRNLGANHGHFAWQRGETPPVFRITEDPAQQPTCSCLAAWRDGRLAIADLQFDAERQRVRDAGAAQDVGDALEWATSGVRVLRDGQVAPIGEIIDAFYDIRHVLAFEHHRDEGERIRRDIYAGYPGTFRDNVQRAWRDRGVPRARYVHNALGIGGGTLIVLQREGTIEEIGAWLKEAGAEDGVILDNGGSVACWAWWVNAYRGGLLSPTVDYRPPGTSAIAFVLHGPVNVDVPGGSVSPTVL